MPPTLERTRWVVTLAACDMDGIAPRRRVVQALSARDAVRQVVTRFDVVVAVQALAGSPAHGG